MQSIDAQGPIRLQAEVIGIIFRNEINGYTVMELENDEMAFTAVGPAPRLGEGEWVEVEGSWTTHRDYGKQLQMTACRVQMPQTTERMERFLASGLIRGCGPVNAHAIVQKFGEQTADILQYAPYRLKEVPGIGLITAEKIGASYVENMELREVVAGLSEYGVTVGQAIRIAKEYGADGVAMVRENPYRLAEDVFGIGFKTADAIAQSMGIESDAPFRLAAGLRYSLQRAAGEGHTYLPSQILVDFTAKQLGTDVEAVKRAAARMVQTGELVLGSGEQEPVYLGVYFHSEQECAVRLHRLCSKAPAPLRTDTHQAVRNHERESGLQLADQQRRAVLAAAQGPLHVITGGPGTGKTTIVQFLLSIFDQAGVEVALCAPTGRAAKRMTEATGRPASTIHRLLEYGRSEDEQEVYGRNEEHPLEAGAVIVDEMSMVDVFLMMRLLRAIKPGTRVIFIGDADQLPSVGPGNVLRDIIGCQAIPVIELDTIYRQDAGSTIPLNAHRINHGQMPQPDGERFTVIECDTPAQVWQQVQAVCRRPNVQVLTPMRKGDLGVAGLNERLQDLLNPSARGKQELAHPVRKFREGDQVMQIRNDYRMEWTCDTGLHQEKGLGVFNGEMGMIRKIDSSAREMTVLFDDDHVVRYDFLQTDALELAYAISIHKSQGSEFDEVVIVLSGGPPMLYTRNLLYTAVTRAKERLWIIGRRGALQQMIHNNQTKARYSGMQQALTALFAR